MDRFVKKCKLDTDEEMQSLRQSVEAAASGSDDASFKFQRNDEINLQVKVRQYCEDHIALAFTWTGTQTVLHRCVLFVGRSWLIVLWHQPN